MTRIDVSAEVDATFRTVVGEARGCCYRDMLGVAYTIRERSLRPGWWGHGYDGVACNPSQFSCWRSDDPNRAHCLDPFDLPEKIWRRCLAASMAAVYGEDAEAPVRLYGGFAGPDKPLCYLIPPHYIDRSIPLPDWATTKGTREIVPDYKSAFRWFATVPGDPERVKP